MCFVDIRTLLIIFGVFYFSEGKACPEKTRPHKTRCEMYYKCVELPSQNHVWISEKCEKGLVYVHNLKICALPGDDWECTLEDLQTQHLSNNKAGDNQKSNIEQPFKKTSNSDSDIYIVTDGDQESNFIDPLEDGKVEVILKSNIANEEESINDAEQYESSGDGIDFTDGFLEATSKETTDILEETNEVNSPPEHETSSPGTPTTNVDPSLTAHLQRLSQLIDGLKKTYQNREKEQAELTPDQLNAFLAHFNIKNKFDNLDLTQTHDNSQEIQHLSTTTSLPVIFNNTSNEDNSSRLTLNRTKIFQTIGNKLKPETKVVLTSSLPKRYGSTGYSNSQIVVNRPEGSVLFSLPPYGGEGHFIEHAIDYDHNSPKISEETLKTVLELSKQMISNQNIPKVVPNPTYYAQPIIQPLFLPPSSYTPSGQSSINSPFSNYFNPPSYNNNFVDNNSGYDRPSISNYNNQNYGHKRPSRPNSGYNSKPGTTIIHNNVIPVHVTSTSSGEKEVVDSYGQSLGLYPSLGTGSSGNSNNEYAFKVTHHYENNKFITTVKPFISSTLTNHYGSAQFPSPYDSAITTVRPPLEYQPSPSTVAQYYTPSTHLSETNVNSLFKPPDRYPTLQYENVARPMESNRPDSTHSTYQQLERPSSYQNFNKNSPFPTQINPNKVSIYPNSEKVESMETEDQREPFNSYDSNSIQPNRPQSNAAQYNTDEISLVDRISALTEYNTNGNKNPYLPRPQQSSYGSNFVQGSNKPKFPSYGGSSQLVNIGGNFISYDVFQNTILPLIGQSTGSPSDDLGNIEVISCQAGIRQPNVTDCTKYYVCSKKDGKVLSYSCPPYTAFNGQTRICDARTYATCAPDAIISSYTVSENKRVQMEAINALNEAKRRREEALKAQKLSNLIQQYSNQLNTRPLYTNQNNFDNEVDNKDILNSYVQQAASMTSSPFIASTTTLKPPKKRKYYCKEGDKVPDQTSIYNYFVCYKNSEGMMKGHKMTCTKGLLFCAMTKLCTLPSKCV